MINKFRWLAVFSAVMLSFAVQAESLVVGYQTGVDPARVDQAEGNFEKTIGQPIVWRIVYDCYFYSAWYCYGA